MRPMDARSARWSSRKRTTTGYFRSPSQISVACLPPRAWTWTERPLLAAHLLLRDDIEEHMKGSRQWLNPLSRGDVLREVIFYSGESAYSFQYRDFAPSKYFEDDAWLRANKGFVITEARAAALVIARLQEEKLMGTRAQ